MNPKGGTWIAPSAFERWRLSAAPTNRQGLLSRLYDARLETDALFEMVRPEAMRDRPIPERHRIVFYVGHLEAFDWNLLRGPCALASFHH
jgi:hypothetical protein